MPHILIVDDVLENIQLLGRLLHQRIDCSIAIAQDGEAALRAIEYQRPDLILLDVMMPRMDGHEVCRRLKENPATSTIPVIFLTAKVEEEDIVAGLDMGAVDYVTKPVRQEVLLARVRTQLNILEKEQKVREQSEQRAKLLHILCHDIANPIAAIRGCSHLLQLDCKEKRAQELIDLIETALASAGGIIDQVRQTLALTEGKRELKLSELSLAEMVSESVSMLSARFKTKEIRVEQDIPAEAAVLAERISLVNSVLNNLLTNALKFSDRGAAVRVIAKPVDDMFELVIADEGIGMSPELCASVFESTVATSRIGTEGEEGTGYGMPLVKAFVEAYGGSVAITSQARSERVSGFTEVRLRLPAVNQDE